MIFKAGIKAISLCSALDVSSLYLSENNNGTISDGYPACIAPALLQQHWSALG